MLEATHRDIGRGRALAVTGDAVGQRRGNIRIGAIMCGTADGGPRDYGVSCW